MIEIALCLLPKNKSSDHIAASKLLAQYDNQDLFFFALKYPKLPITLKTSLLFLVGLLTLSQLADTQME